jgi:CPA1 family monovalent cation:H+ antiporter
MPIASEVVLLFVIATAVAIVAGRLRIPYTVALVVAGLGIGASHVIAAPPLTRDLLFSVFLPGLLFAAAFDLRVADLWRNKLTIGGLAVPGLLLAIAATTAILLFVARIAGSGPFTTAPPWQAVVLFAALISATDPIAIVALFRALGASHRLTVLLEAESLFNDGTAVVAFALVLALVRGAAMSVPALALDFMSAVGGGVFVGLVVGMVADQAIRRLDDPFIETAITMIVAYGSFVVAEQLHSSGVIATVTAGLVCGNVAARSAMSARTLTAVRAFWDYVAFALNSLVFLLIGFTVRLSALGTHWILIAIAFAAILVARAAIVGTTAGVLHRSRERMPFAWAALLTWGGVRGALSMVLALSIPPTFPDRDLVVAVTFGVATASILVQGLTMPFLTRRLGVLRSGHG